MKPVMTIARREFSVRMKSKATIITTLVVVAVLLIAGVVASRFNIAEADAEKIGVTTQTQSYGAVFSPETNPFLDEDSPWAPRYKVLGYADDAELEKAVTEGKINLGIGGTTDAPVVVSDGSPSPSAMLMINSTAQSVVLGGYISNLGGSLEEANEKMSTVQVQVKDISGAEDDADGFNLASYIVVMVLITLLFATVMGSGQLVAGGVIEEKLSRVVEILISTVSPNQLLVGKILGITVVGTLRILIMGGAGVVALAISGLAQGIEVDFASFSAWYVVWYLLGLATYMVLFAGAGALASRQEDVGQAMMPLILLQLGGFYAAIFSIYQPNGLFIRIIALLPFLNCYAMPARQITSTALTWWEPWLSVAINLAILPLLVWLGGRLYRRGILATGGRLKILEALRQKTV